eukprot:TCALIF_05883-PA protein Name:"Similar to NDUFA13 NADH dehydrogenase [ubiquinone] 1 alpha subcomplex subunit 13 (Macaca fascicularis)" AED:0.14 eAED:0.14 QI:0/0.66/0.5/1/1/1/4/309/146
MADLPPKGGYAPINYNRIPAKTLSKPGLLFLGGLAVNALGIWTYKTKRTVIERKKLEETSVELGLEPLMLAEMDRAYLLQMRRNRDVEAEFTRDWPNWEVGRWFQQPLFYTIPEDELPRLSPLELFIHADPKTLKKEINYRKNRTL